jgi:hypothetical protein
MDRRGALKWGASASSEHSKTTRGARITTIGSQTVLSGSQTVLGESLSPTGDSFVTSWVSLVASSAPPKGPNECLVTSVRAYSGLCRTLRTSRASQCVIPASPRASCDSVGGIGHARPNESDPRSTRSGSPTLRGGSLVTTRETLQSGREPLHALRESFRTFPKSQGTWS